MVIIPYLGHTVNSHSEGGVVCGLLTEGKNCARMEKKEAKTVKTVWLPSRRGDRIPCHDNWEGQLPGVSLRLKDDEMSRLGINKALLSTGLSMHLGNGLPVTTVWDGDYPIDVVLKDGGNIEPSYEDVGNQYVSAWGVRFLSR